MVNKKYNDGTNGVTGKVTASGKPFKKAKPIHPAYKATAHKSPAGFVRAGAPEAPNVLTAPGKIDNNSSNSHIYKKSVAKYSKGTNSINTNMKEEKKGLGKKITSIFSRKKDTSDVNVSDYVGEERASSFGDSPKIKIKGDRIKIKGNGTKFKGEVMEKPKPSIKRAELNSDMKPGVNNNSYRAEMNDDYTGPRDKAKPVKKKAAATDLNNVKVTLDDLNSAYNKTKTVGPGPTPNRIYSEGSKKSTNKPTNKSNNKDLGAAYKRTSGSNTGPTSNRSYGTTTTKPKESNKALSDAYNSSKRTPSKQAPVRKKTTVGPALSEKEKSKGFLDYMIEGTANTNQRTKEAKERAAKSNKENPRIGIDTVVLNSRRDMYTRDKGGVDANGKYTKPGIRLKSGYEHRDGKIIDRSTGKEAVRQSNKVASAGKQRLAEYDKQFKAKQDNIAKLKKEQQEKSAKILASRGK
jgi:hypothetical protein